MNHHTEFRIGLYHFATLRHKYWTVLYRYVEVWELHCIVSSHWGQKWTVLYAHIKVQELDCIVSPRWGKIEVSHMITLMYMNLIASYRHKVCWFFQASIYEPCIEKCMNHMNEKDTQPYLLSYFSSRFWKTCFFFLIPFSIGMLSVGTQAVWTSNTFSKKVLCMFSQNISTRTDPAVFSPSFYWPYCLGSRQRAGQTNPTLKENNCRSSPPCDVL